jgi:GNAT superfamily N-acetyltransferase
MSGDTMAKAATSDLHLTPAYEVLRAEGKEDADAVIGLIRQAKEVFPFLPRSVYEKAVLSGELLLCWNGAGLVGCLRFHHRRDGITTVHEIVVAPSARNRGAGRALLDALEEDARSRGQKRLRLKCPIDQPANGFYARIGFQRVAIEPSRQRHVVIWERPFASSGRPAPSWEFYASLTKGASDLRHLIRGYYKGYDDRVRKPPFHPFRRLIFTPLFCSPSSRRLLKELASELPDQSVTLIPHILPRPKVIFDSGGYQVQMGRLSYEELCARLRDLYATETWADYYVLPDHVPTSSDSDRDATRKADDTMSVGENFLAWFPELRATSKFIGVVHGRTEAEMRRGARRWSDLGVGYVAFGSFGTSGPKGSVNLLSNHSLALLAVLSEAAREHGQQLHIFGIGNPGYLRKFVAKGAIAQSFDSSGWWKMAGFGYVLLEQRFVNICRRGRGTKSLSDLEQELPSHDHSCPFCADVTALREQRWLRVLHNLTCYGEIISRNHGAIELPE